MNTEGGVDDGVPLPVTVVVTVWSTEFQLLDSIAPVMLYSVVVFNQLFRVVLKFQLLA